MDEKSLSIHEFAAGQRGVGGRHRRACQLAVADVRVCEYSYFVSSADKA